MMQEVFLKTFELNKYAMPETDLKFKSWQFDGIRVSSLDSLRFFHC